MSIKLFGVALVCALATAAPSLGGDAPIFAKALAVGTMKATTINATAGSMILDAITIKPGGSFGWHTHSSPVAVVVTGGTLTVFDPSVANCAPFKVSKGQFVRRTREPRPSCTEREQNPCHALRDVPRSAKGPCRERRS